MNVQHRLRLGERVDDSGPSGSAGHRRSAARSGRVGQLPAALTPQRVVSAEPQNTARVVTPAKDNPVEEPAAAAEPTGAHRIPLAGRAAA